MTRIDATANSESGIVTEQIPATTRQDKTAVLLWIVQGLLALIFLFTGGMKLILPVELMTKQMPLPGMFLRFIGVAEVLGAIGLIVPGVTGIRTSLTPLAATGLAIITTGATVLTLASGQFAPALIPLAVALLASFVAYGRWRLAPAKKRAEATSEAQEDVSSESEHPKEIDGSFAAD
jgi:hypothetical protein